MIKKSFSFAIIIFICLIICIALSWPFYQFTRQPLLSNRNNLILDIKPGSSAQAVISQLVQTGDLKHPQLFTSYLRLHHNSRKIQAGEYLLSPGLTPFAVMQKLVLGEVVLHSFTIIDGWNFQQLVQAINQNTFLTHNLTNQPPTQVMQLVSGKNQSPEGEFFPNTYLFAKGTSDIVVLKQAYQQMQTFLMQAWQKRSANLPYQTPYQALIVASMIEKEASLPAERAKIAGVIVRRLEKNMYLQIDPTVIYAMGDKYQGKITQQDLKIKSAYNTYIKKGLPPTPIAFPNATAIEAALHPEAGNALYFVANGKGGHAFSDTLAEHDANIREYILRRTQTKTKNYLW